MAETQLKRLFPEESDESIKGAVSAAGGDLEKAVSEVRRNQKTRLQFDKKTILPGEPGFCSFSMMPVVLVTAVDSAGKPSVCTVGAWSVVNAEPKMFGVSMCERDFGPYFWRRYTSKCIDETGEFVINIPHAGLTDAWMAVASRSRTREPDLDKFALAGITMAPASKVKAPLIAECPVSMELVVKGRLNLPTHDFIVGEVVAYHSALNHDPRIESLDFRSTPTLKLK